MSLFFVWATLITLACLAYVLRPLLRQDARAPLSSAAANLAVHRDQRSELEADLRSGLLAPGQYEAACRELERRLLDDVGVDAAPAARATSSPLILAVLGAAVPLATLGIYLAVGSPQVLLAPAPAAPSAAPHDVSQEQIGAMVERLAARLRDNPDNVEGWAMLGRSYQVLGRFAEASAAFAEAVKRTGDDAQLLADYADVLAMKQGRKLAGEPEKLVARALKADPNNFKALALAGTIAFDRKDYARAIAYWERIAQRAPPGSEAAQSAQASVEEARALLGGTRAPVGMPGGIRGVVRITPELAGKLAPGDTVFIYARAAEGPRMPLAIVRKQARELPLAFVLDDSMAMTPELKLSSVPRVVVSARVSRTAQAARRPGDLEGQSRPVPPDAQGVQVVIDSEVR